MENVDCLSDVAFKGLSAEEIVAQAPRRLEHDDSAALVRRLVNGVGVGRFCRQDEPERGVQFQP